jgi:hypothetical protein
LRSEASEKNLVDLKFMDLKIDIESIANLRNRTFICPHPLVYADHTKEYPDSYTTHWAFKLGDCAVRCPTIVLTKSEFHEFNLAVWYLAMASFLLSSVVLAFHFPEASRYNIRIFFVAGFALGAFALGFFPIINDNYQIFCSPDRAHYITQAPLCILQSCLIVFSYSWIALWGAIYSMDIYLVTSLTEHTFLKQLRRYYFWFALLFTIGITSSALIADNYGYDYTTALPNCLYLFAQNDTYFWTTLVLPYVISASICLAASIGSAYRLQSVFVNSQRSSRKRILRNVINNYNRNQARGRAGRGEGRNQQLAPVEDYDRESTMNFAASEMTPNPSGVGMNDLSRNGDRGAGGGAHDEDDEDETPRFRQDWSIDLENSRKPYLDSAQSSSNHEGLIRIPSDPAYNPMMSSPSSSSPIQPLPTVMENSFSSGSRLVSHHERSTLPGTTSTAIASSPSESSASQAMSSFNIELKEGQRTTENSRVSMQPDHEDDYVVSMISEDCLHDLRSSLPSHGTGGHQQDDTEFSSSGQDQSRTITVGTTGTGMIEENMIPESAANALFRQIAEKLVETWKYNGRIILFITVYCLLSFYVIPVFVYLFHLTYDKNVQSAEDFIACLLTASVTSPIQTQAYVDQYSQDQCGEHPNPRPPYGLV